MLCSISDLHRHIIVVKIVNSSGQNYELQHTLVEVQWGKNRAAWCSAERTDKDRVARKNKKVQEVCLVRRTISVVK